MRCGHGFVAQQGRAGRGCRCGLRMRAAGAGSARVVRSGSKCGLGAIWHIERASTLHQMAPLRLLEPFRCGVKPSTLHQMAPTSRSEPYGDGGRRFLVREMAPTPTTVLLEAHGPRLSAGCGARAFAWVADFGSGLVAGAIRRSEKRLTLRKMAPTRGWSHLGQRAFAWAADSGSNLAFGATRCSEPQRPPPPAPAAPPPARRRPQRPPLRPQRPPPAPPSAPLPSAPRSRWARCVVPPAGRGGVRAIVAQQTEPTREYARR